MSSLQKSLGISSYYSKKLGLPYLLKPRRSYASKGITQIHTQADHDYLRGKWGGQFMVQQIVGDDTSEYTIGVFGFGDGTHGGNITFSPAAQWRRRHI